MCVPVPVHPITIYIRVGSAIYEVEAPRASADPLKLIYYYNQLSYNLHHKKQHSCLPANMYEASTHTQNDPGLKHGMGNEPGRKK